MLRGCNSAQKYVRHTHKTYTVAESGKGDHTRSLAVLFFRLSRLAFSGLPPPLGALTGTQVAEAIELHVSNNYLRAYIAG